MPIYPTPSSVTARIESYTPTPAEFAIPSPSGAYTAGYCHLSVTSSFEFFTHRLKLQTGIGHTSYSADYDAAYDGDLALTSDQLADVIAAAGSTLDLSFIIVSSGEFPPDPLPDDIEDAVTPYLVLTDSGGGGTGTWTWNRVLAPAQMRIVAAPGDFRREHSVTLAPARMTAKAISPNSTGGGSGKRILLLPARVSLRNLQFHASGAGGTGGDGSNDGGTAENDGNLKYSQYRDMAGAASTTEVAVADSAAYMAAGCQIGPDWGALYTREGVVYWKRTTNPDDWSAETETDTGLRGAVYGLARNRLGVLLGIVNSDAVVSRDGGATWTVAGAIPMIGAPLDRTIVASDDWFIVVYASRGTVRHLVTVDSGAHWA